MEGANKGQTVLIVDDSELNRSVLTDMLCDDFDVIEAANGREALAILEERLQEVAIMLLDVIMPVMDGFELLTAMNKNGMIDVTPVVVITSATGQSYMDKAYDLGAVDFISRPFDVRNVRRRVLATLLLAARQRELALLISPDFGRGEDDVAASARTLRLLENERIKYRFFAAMSKETQFEYKPSPETLTLSEWGADFLGVDEIVHNPTTSVIGTTVFAPADFDDLKTHLARSTPAQPVIERTYPLTVKGASRWCRVIARSMWSERAEYIGAIGKIVDIHEDYERISRLERMAAHDQLTGLLNHTGARARIEEVMKLEGGQCVMLLIDLDCFKQINDTHGHLAGDTILRQVAVRLHACIRVSDIAARVGGDEFLVFLVESGSDPEPLVRRVFEALTGSYDGFPVTLSVGAARLLPGEDYEELFNRADKALYAVKKRGRNAFAFYDDSMSDMLSALSPIDDGEE